MILIQKREDSLEIWYKFLIYPEYIILLFREIEIEDLKEKRQYFFKANRWLAVEKGDGKVSCNLTPTKDEEISVSFFINYVIQYCMHIDCFWSRRRLDRGLGKYQDKEIWKYFTPRLHTIAFFLQLFYIPCKEKTYAKRFKGGKKDCESFSAWTGKKDQLDILTNNFIALWWLFSFCTERHQLSVFHQIETRSFGWSHLVLVGGSSSTKYLHQMSKVVRSYLYVVDNNVGECYVLWDTPQTRTSHRK